jgi:hypothetical protein
MRLPEVPVMKCEYNRFLKPPCRGKVVGQFEVGASRPAWLCTKHLKPFLKLFAPHRPRRLA